MTSPEQEIDQRASHPRGENADNPPAEPSATDPDLKAESGEASGGG